LRIDLVNKAVLRIDFMRVSIGVAMLKHQAKTSS
jgi:hypothetical protein